MDGLARADTGRVAQRHATILSEVDLWHSRGLVDDDERAFLRERYTPGAPSRSSQPEPMPEMPPRSAWMRAYATHLLGGLLLGAALVALVQFFVPRGAWQPFSAVLVAAACCGAAYLAERQRGELVAEAGVAAGLVAAGAAPLLPHALPMLGAMTAILAVGVTSLRRGRSALALAAVAVYFLGARHATATDLFNTENTGTEWLFLLTLLGYGALLVRRLATERSAAGPSDARWSSYALATQGVAIVIALFPLLDAQGVTDAGLAALAVLGLSGALFALGVRLDERPLVATMSVVAALAATTLAFLAAGPALAAVILLLVGALLVWRAEAVRGYMGRAVDAPPRA